MEFHCGLAIMKRSEEEILCSRNNCLICKYNRVNKPAKYLDDAAVPRREFSRSNSFVSRVLSLDPKHKQSY
jgi:hypothetical protein